MKRITAYILALAMVLASIPAGADTTGHQAGASTGVYSSVDFSYTLLNNLLTDNSSAAIASSDGREEADTIKVLFSHTVPTDATIDGIEIAIRWRSEGGDYDQTKIQLIKVATTVGTDKSTGSSIPSSNQTITFGGAADLWGITWTPAEVNAATFGVAIGVEDTTSRSDDIYIEYVSSSITYTPSGGGGPSAESMAYGFFLMAQE